MARITRFDWTNLRIVGVETNAIVGRVALEIMRDARKLAPRDTGNLRNSILAEEKTESWVVGTSVHYAPHQEFGTRTGVRPKAFMRTAMRNAQGKYGGTVTS